MIVKVERTLSNAQQDKDQSQDTNNESSNINNLNNKKNRTSSIEGTVAEATMERGGGGHILILQAKSSP